MNHSNSSTPLQQYNIELRRGPVVPNDVDVERIAAAAESAQSPSTRRVYGSAWRRFTRWAQDRHYPSLPAEPVAVAAYLVERAQTVKPATLAVIAAAIGSYHRAHSLANPAATDGVKIILSGLAHQGQSGDQAQARGLPLQDIAAIRATARTPRVGRGGHKESAIQARDRGILVVAPCRVMFDGLPRRSEAADLRRSDIRREHDRSGRMLVRRSKTDQVGEGKVLWISPGSILALAELAAIRPDDKPDDSIFRLSGSRISSRIAQACEAAGLVTGYSGHSLRVGAALALAAANISLAAIMENGRWQSARIPARYSRHAAAASSGMAKLYAQGD